MRTNSIRLIHSIENTIVDFPEDSQVMINNTKEKKERIIILSREWLIRLNRLIHLYKKKQPTSLSISLQNNFFIINFFFQKNPNFDRCLYEQMSLDFRRSPVFQCNKEACKLLLAHVELGLCFSYFIKTIRSTSRSNHFSSSYMYLYSRRHTSNWVDEVLQSPSFSFIAYTIFDIQAKVSGDSLSYSFLVRLLGFCWR